MPKRSDVRAAFNKALTHLDEGERKLVTDAVSDGIRVFDLCGAMLDTPTTDDGVKRIFALRDEIGAIDKKWTHD